MSSYNQTSQIMRRVPVGGTGALIERPNSFQPKVKKVPTTFFSAPAVSSLPYLSEQVKYKDNETILMLSADIARQKEVRTANYIYSDKDEALLEDNLGNDMVKIEKYKEPSTEDMLRKYLTEELGKRNEEKQNIEAKRITGVDSSIEEFREKMEENKKVAFQKAQEYKQEASERARRLYLEEALKRRQIGETGFEGISGSELQKRLARAEYGREAKPLEVLETPIRTIGLSPENPADGIIKRFVNLKGSLPEAEFNEALFNFYKIRMDKIDGRISKIKEADLNRQIMVNNLSSYLSSKPTDAEKRNVLKYYLLAQNPKIRGLLETLNVPAPFIRSQLPEKSKNIVDRIIEFNELENEPRDALGRKIKQKVAPKEKKSKSKSREAPF